MKYALTLFLLSALAGAQVSAGIPAPLGRPTISTPARGLAANATRPVLGLTGLSILHLASAAFDTGTTVHNLANGCHEDNPMLGSHPSTAHVIGFEAGITAGELIAFHFLRKHHPKLAIAFLGESVVEHGVAGGMNTQQRCF